MKPRSLADGPTADGPGKLKATEKDFCTRELLPINNKLNFNSFRHNKKLLRSIVSGKGLKLEIRGEN